MPSTLVQLSQEIICLNLLLATREVLPENWTEKRRPYLDWDYWAIPVPGFGAPAPACSSSLCARRLRLQPHREAFHRRRAEVPAR